MADESVILNPGAGGAAIAVDTIAGVSHELVKIEFGSDGTATQVDAANPLPVTDALAEAALASIAAEDFATQTTLAAILAKIIASPATEATLAAILAKIIAAPSTEAKQDVMITSLAAIDAGIPAALGQTAMANSMPVVIASDQSAITVSISGSVTDNTTLYNDSIIVAGPLSSILTTGYASIVTMVMGEWVGSLIFEGSNDDDSWATLMTLPDDEVAMRDYVTGNGIFIIKSTSKHIRLNVLQLQSGSIDVKIIGRTVIGESGADRLSLAMDKVNGTPLYVEETATKKDIRNALIPSDAPANITVGGSFATNQLMFLVDTIGYQSLSIQAITLPVATTVQGSNDGVTWVSIIGTTQSTTTASASLSGAGSYSFPAVTRFIRALCPSTGTYSFNIYLRQTPVSLLGGVGTPTNLQAVGGTAVVTGGVAGIQAIGGNIAVGSAPTANPIPLAIDTSGLTRRILTDTGGRLLNAITDQTATTRPMGGISPAASIQNVASLTVQDTSQFEGQSFMELLAQILMELKINNQYMSDLPLVLRGQSGSFDEPQQFRNDNSLFAIQ